MDAFECRSELEARVRQSRESITICLHGEAYRVEHVSDALNPDGPSTWPYCTYATKELAAARVLQLLGITEPIAPQDHPEAVGIGVVS